ncbi:restriction endonuclease subunit S [Rahnella aquatilis]|uniref:restriction endonuclease subunit S n=1 Tax=Rahnella aquatilis TaxID=34038 RepID=UPI00064745AB|nr:restriction endonuclease subunit S [Rahnella aquatilis]
MSKVPAGWVNTKLQNIAKIKSGSTPLRAKGTRYFTQNGTPWVKTLDLNNSEIHITDEEITDLALKETSCTLFPANTVLVAMYGGFNQIGRTGLITKPSASNQALSGLILNEEIADPKYVLNYLNGNVSKWKEFAASSRKDPNITRDDVCNFPILLPPLPEQTKIAKILSTWDKAIATTEKLIGNSQQQKKALMQSLLTGKKRLPGFEGEWKTHQLAKMGKIVSGGTPDTNNPQFWDGDILWMTPTDVTALKTKYIKNTSRKITKIGVQESSAKAIPAGSLLVCTRATIGLMSISSTEITTNQGFKNLVPNEKFNVEFLYFLFSFYKKYFIRYACGSTFLELSKKDFEKLEFSCPLYTEQQKIAAILTAADNEIDLLQKKLAFLKQEKAALMQQLLTGKRRVKINTTEECMDA